MDRGTSLTFSQAARTIAVVPLPKGKTQASAIHGLANVVWSGSQNQCAAMEWVKYLASADAERILGSDRHRHPGHGRAAGRVGGLAADLDLQVFLDAVDYSFPVPNPLSGPEWGDDVRATLIEAWSGGIPRDEVCARVNEVADAALKAG